MPKKSSGSKWIQGAIKKPGALRKELGVKEGQKIPTSRINREISKLRNKSKEGTITKSESTELKRLNLAKTLRNFNK